MNRRLSDYFGPDAILRDGGFVDLGHADSTMAGTLAYCDSVHYLGLANANPKVSCLLVTPELAGATAADKGVAAFPDPRNAFYRLHEELDGLPQREETVIHPSAIVSPRAKIGRGVVVAERVVIRDDVELGDGSFIDAGAVLGAEGILYRREAGGNLHVRHRGTVRIGSHAVVLANAVVVRGIYPGEPTVVGDHAIVGIAAIVGHEAHLERNCVVSGNCVIARRARIGEGAWIGTSAMVREYVCVGARASVKAGSVVVEDVPADAEVSGNFAVPHRRRLLQYLKDRK